MEASSLTIGRLLRDRVFAAASVQRDYQWGKPECQALIDDLDKAFLLTDLGRKFAAGEPVGEQTIVADTEEERSDAPPDDEGASELQDFETAEDVAPPSSKFYYLGAVALGPKDEDKRLTVYDGVQRLTTLTILLAVLRDVCTDKGEADQLHRLIFDGQKPRLRLIVRDGMLFDQVQRRGATIEVKNDAHATETGERVRNAVNLFLSTVADWTPERKRAFARYITDDVQVVAIVVADTTLAFQLFYTTNTRGKRLESADILKAQILDLVARERGGEVADGMASQWTALQKKLGGDLEPYLRAMDFYYRRSRQRENTWVHELFTALSTKRHATKFIGWLLTGANAWVTIQEAPRATHPASPIRASLARLHLIDGNYWEAVALAILMGKHTRKADLLFRLEQTCLSMAIINEQARDRPKILAAAIAALAKTPEAKWHPYPLANSRLSRVELKLRRSIDDQVARELVLWLEAIRWGANIPPTLNDLTLEHVLPQKGTQEGSRWRIDFPDPATIHSYAWQLGNFAMVPESINSKAGNRDFVDKVPIYQTVAGQFKLLDDVMAESAWNPEMLERRTTALADETLKLLTRKTLAAPKPRAP